MSRSKRFVTGLLSSYAAIGVNILYTIASVPLALRYLDKEQFGLWALVAQMSAYLGLLELGMRGSVARILSDHKDQIEGGAYGSVLRTGSRVFLIQGFVVTVCGLILAAFGPRLLDLPLELHHRFTILTALQCTLIGIGLAVAGLGAPLWCHQRLDISALTSSACMVVSFAVLWAGFALGWGIYSLLAVSVASLLVGTSAIYIACKRLGFYPSSANRGKYDSAIFKELFHFGSGLFLMNLGTLMASASQVILVSRLMGVESAAIWSIVTKLYNMAQQFVAKILESSVGGLTEMLVRGDFSGMRKRFRDIVTVSAVLAVFVSGAIALLNGAFVELWTSGKITWDPWNNLLLGCVLFSTAVARCHTGLVGITKQIRGMKYINLLEGAAFIILSLFLVPDLGMAGLLVATLLCNTGIVGIYGISRTAQYFGIRKREVILWIGRPIAVLCIVALAFSLGQWLGLESYEVRNRLLAGAAIFGIVIPPCIWIFAMDTRLRMEIASGGKRIFSKVRQSLRLA
jgi:O-antigen/teichoic acid export membrane protein